MEIREVRVEDVLRARDERAARQRRMLDDHRAPLISFTMNIAGPVKRDAWIERAFGEGVRRIEAVLAGRRTKVLERCPTVAFTGCEQLWSVDADAARLKAWMRAVEEEDELGRLFDVDVIGVDGRKLSRSASGEERRCLICFGPARACARARTHSAGELYRRAQEIIRNFFREQSAQRIGMLAERALLYELITTPKPGLVDCEDCGAHRDMDRFTFVDSACALRGYFEECARIGSEHPDGDAFERLRHAGQRAEADMLAATGGANTHKGALFSLGLLCCAAGMGFGEDFSMSRMLGRAAALAQASLRDFQELSPGTARTGGERQYLDRGLTGARGEAASGFRTAREIALPALEEALRQGRNLNDAGLSALVALMAAVSDSNILRRAGAEGQRRVHEEARRLAGQPFSHDDLRAMNDRLVQDNLSPGGSADLLAVAYFLHSMTEVDA